MAKEVTGKIWKFDAADQYEGWGNRNESTAPVHLSKPWVEFITIESGATGGTYDVRETDGGKPITGAITLGANAHTQIVVGGYVDGVYIESFGSDGQILVKHGQA